MTAVDDLQAELERRGVDLKAGTTAELRAAHPDLEYLWLAAAAEADLAKQLHARRPRRERRKMEQAARRKGR